jgi:hypothetical protein
MPVSLGQAQSYCEKSFLDCKARFGALSAGLISNCLRFGLDDCKRQAGARLTADQVVQGSRGANFGLF